MKKENKPTSLIDALKEYNKSLSEQIGRIKAFIEEIDKQLSYHQKVEKEITRKTIDTPFSRAYLLKKAQNNIN